MLYRLTSSTSFTLTKRLMSNAQLRQQANAATAKVLITFAMLTEEGLTKPKLDFISDLIVSQFGGMDSSLIGTTYSLVEEAGQEQLVRDLAESASFLASVTNYADKVWLLRFLITLVRVENDRSMSFDEASIMLQITKVLGIDFEAANDPAV